jgi:hypothetical protein
MSQEQPHGFDQAPIAALPPVFAHVDIAEHYQEGRFSSRLEAEIADILWNGQPVEEPGVGTNPSRQGPFIAPQARDPQGSPLPRDEGGMQGEESPLSLTDEALAVLHNLNCIALIQGGQVLPLLDIEHMSTPMTAIQRAHLYHSAARTLLESIAAILEDRDNRQ